jgi:hypothetical protein
MIFGTLSLIIAANAQSGSKTMHWVVAYRFTYWQHAVALGGRAMTTRLAIDPGQLRKQDAQRTKTPSKTLRLRAVFIAHPSWKSLVHVFG